MTGAGRPLRFLGMMLGGWVVLRIAFLLPEAGSLPAALRELLPLPGVANATGSRVSMVVPPPARRPIAPTSAEAVMPGTTAEALRPRPDPMRVQLALLGLIGFGGASVVASPQQSGSAPLVLPPRSTGSRFTGSAWLVARDGGAALSDAGQLGGSQAGVRVRYALDARGKFAATARVSTPLEGKGAEAALGVEWRPTRHPVAVIAEQRVGLDGTRGGQALFAVGGIAPTPVAAGFSVEGYAQAGGVRRGGRTEAFVDGSLRATREVARIGASGLSLGAGAWGGAQRNAARLDLGPSATVALPVTGRPLRLSVDWRQRVAGRARPGSGLALTLGTDF